jgi:hypothetical protein
MCKILLTTPSDHMLVPHGRIITLVFFLHMIHTHRASREATKNIQRTSCKKPTHVCLERYFDVTLLCRVGHVQRYLQVRVCLRPAVAVPLLFGTCVPVPGASGLAIIRRTRTLSALSRHSSHAPRISDMHTRGTCAL